MKKIYLLLTLLVFGFTLKASISGQSDHLCPGETYDYRTNYTNPDYKYNWTVTGGKIVNGGNDIVWIEWYDTNKTHKVSVSISYANGNLITTQRKEVKVLSFKDVTPKAFTDYNSVIPPGVKSPVTYKIPALEFPKFTSLHASEYEWIIPQGWKYYSRVSDGVTPFTTDKPSITVTPDDCSGGKIKVRGLSGCSGTAKSLYREKEITRYTSIVFSNSNTTICGKKKEITLNIGSVPNASYQWTKPSSWTWKSSTNSNVVKVMPDGYSGGEISVVTNGCTSWKRKKTIQLINWDTNEPTPTVSGSKILCSSGSRYTLNNAYSNASQITWSVSPSSLFYGATFGNGTTPFLKAKSSTVNGYARLKFTLRNQCGSVYQVKEYSFWVGTPDNLRGEIGEQEDFEDQYFCKSYHYSAENSIKIRCDGDDFNSNYQWDSRSNNFAYNTFQNRMDIQPHTKGFIAFRVKVDNACGWSDWGEFMYPVLDCDGSGGPGGMGEEMIVSDSINKNSEFSFIKDVDNSEYQNSNSLSNTKNIDSEVFMMSYPNPANEYTELNFYRADEISEYQKSSPVMVRVPIEDQLKGIGEYEVKIWHERKGLVKQLRSSDKKLQIPTSNLDEGFYFLHIIINGKAYKQKLKIQR